MKERLYQYALLMRLHRPIGIYLLLWPTLWALWIAGEGRPDIKVAVVFVLGVIVMRSAGCVINDYADRRIDPHVSRTKDRPIAAGRVSSREALKLFAGLCLIAFGLVLLMNLLTIYLSVAALALAIVYPFMKRYTQLPQLFLGAAFAWAAPMAFAAQTGHVPAPAWLLFSAALLWTAAYDTMYAMADRADDIRIGVKSTAILFGRADKLIIALLQTAVLCLLFLIGRQAGLGAIYIASLAAAAVFAGYQQSLIRNREPSRCLRAFLNNQWFGAVVFAGIAGDYFFKT
ncbi:MAG: 4-hydroxybenzoate octaprenyltransferase [Gammaproteobacteria bacterium]|nr:4-hydroxybenzoate octaprenyltransferase [Gammaproteobacteria bacterium]